MSTPGGPDAATAESERRAWAIAGHLERDREAVKAERDAALAAIERVRAMHTPTLPGYGMKSCVHDGRAWPCPTRAALDGAPEPEVKP